MSRSLKRARQGMATDRFRTALSSTRFRHAEDGSVTVLALFIFLMIIFVAGMAVDLMRFETRRAALQNTLDAATLAATNIRSTANADALVRDFMEKRGYDRNRVNVTVQESRSGADPTTNTPGFLAARSVNATYDLDVNTIFMPFIGIEELKTVAGGGAQEGLTPIEISLVVDISNSMNFEGRLADLKTAATGFIDQVIDPARSDLPVTISIVPFNHTVVAPDMLLNQLDTNAVVPVPQNAQAPFANAVTQYTRSAPLSKCVRFGNPQMVTTDLEDTLPPALNPNYLKLRAINPTDPLDMMGYYASYYGGAPSDASTPPNDENWLCNPNFYPAILPWGTDAGALKTYINAMTAHGNTSTDTGLKWGVAMLDPAFRSVVTNLVASGDLPSQLDGRPYDYTPGTFMKVVVLMTDGANTRQHDIAPAFKNGPSTVWYSAEAANETDPITGADWSSLHVVDNLDASGNQGSDGVKDRNKTWYDGYYVYRSAAAGNARWLRAHDPFDTIDGAVYPVGQLPSDAVQLTWAEVFERFSVGHAGLLHYDQTHGDAQSWSDLFSADDVVIDNLVDGEADRRMTGRSDNSEHGLCDAAKVQNDILVYTIAFKAGTAAEALMRDCATSDGYYFNAQDGAALDRAFSKIAATILTLRLTQ